MINYYLVTLGGECVDVRTSETIFLLYALNNAFAELVGNETVCDSDGCQNISSAQLSMHVR